MWEWIQKYWIEELFALVVACMSAGYARLAKKLKTERRKNQAIENGMNGLLRIQIIDTYERCKAHGNVISISRKDAIVDVYRSYVALCNSQEAVDDTVKQLYEEIIHMPIG